MNNQCKPQTDKYKELNQYRDLIDPFLKDIESNILFGNKHNVITSSFNVVCNQIKASIDENPFEKDNEESVKKSLEVIEKAILNEPITSHFRSFCDSYLNLIRNWNRNINNNDNIEIIATRLIRFLQSQYTMVETIDVLKYQRARMRDFLHMAPGGIEMSKHYLNRFAEELDGE